MKIKLLIISFLVAISTNLMSQNNTKIEEILKIKVELVNKIDIKSGEYFIYLKNDFAKSSIINTQDYEKIRNSTITKIQLVYTQYKESDKFDQTKLNRSRLQSLYDLDAKLFDNNLIDWNIICQTQCKNKDEGTLYFHGFIIYYKPEQTETTIKEEVTIFETVLKSIDEVLESKTEILDSSLDSLEYKVPSLKWSDYSDLIYSPSFDKYTTGQKDTVVLSVLERNKEWKNSLVVIDVTGSMSPFYTQLFVWLKLNENINNIKYVVCFNDGDSKETKNKKVGQTGGIYMSENNDFDALKTLLLSTIAKGCGGDAPENNIEAIIKSTEKYNDFEQIILIADNFANMRDYELISKLNKPVRVVMCGAWNIINTQYLDLARETNGSIHTIESDINNLFDISEGKTIKINEVVYVIEKGKFVLLKNL